MLGENAFGGHNHVNGSILKHLMFQVQFWEFVVFGLQFDDAVDAHGSLPESLDIGDVSEPVMPADSASSKQKNATAGASTSSHHLWIDPNVNGELICYTQLVLVGYK